MIYKLLAEWTSILLRSLHIHVLNFPRLFQKLEPPKAAIQKSRIKALLRSSIHIAPLGVSIFLIQLNWRKQYYVQESPYISALPYLAKLHEILMQMSIAAIVATWIRRGLLNGAGLEFGAVVAIAQTSNPAYIFSPEFLGSMSAVWFRTSKAWRTLSFGIAVALAIALASTVGPSSTVAMVPRAGKFYKTGDVFTFNLPESECFPAELIAQPVDRVCAQLYNSTTERDTSNFHCSPDDIEATIAMSYIIQQNGGRDGEVTTELGGASALRQFKTWIKTPANYDPYSESGFFVQDRVVQSPFNATRGKLKGTTAVGTTQQLNVASMLNDQAQSVVRGDFDWNDKNQGGVPISYSVETKAPYVTAECFVTQFYQQIRTVNADGISNGSISAPYEFSSTDRVQFPNFHEDNFDYLNITMEEFQRISFSSNVSQILWIDPPSQYRPNISILALVQRPTAGIVCAVKAAWGPTTMNSTSSVEARSKSVWRDSVQASSIPEPWKNHTTWPAEIVSISPEFMNLAFPLRDATNTTSKEVNDLIEWTMDGLVLPEILVIGMTAGGMSRLAYDMSAFSNTSSYAFGPATLPGKPKYNN